MPRLFVAINFPKTFADKLYDGVVYLKNTSLESTPSRVENLHLTLAFIGETPKVKNAVSALKNTALSPFEISVDGFGTFPSKDGEICFAKVSDKPVLQDTAKAVRESLVAYKFSIDTKPFKPHITLCRRFTPSDSFDVDKLCKLLPTDTIPVKEISLMSSESINGKLVYTEIFRKTL